MPDVHFHSVIYISTASSDLTVKDLSDIFTVSRKNNADKDLTGLLCFNGTNFMQFLEGSRDAVNMCINRIDADSRHKAMVIVNREESRDREFPDWAMASSVIDSAPGNANVKLSELLNAATVSKKTWKIFDNFRSLGHGV